MSETVSTVTRISDQELAAVILYETMIERFDKVPDEIALPMMAVRLMVRRVGLDGLLQGLVIKGVPWTAAAARHEMIVRNRFLEHMISAYPPDDPADVTTAREEMAHSLAVLDGAEASGRLTRYLSRLLTRERALRVGAPSASPLASGSDTRSSPTTR